MSLTGKKPAWLTFDCYGTLVQFDEGLLDAVTRILAKRGAHAVEPSRLIDVYPDFLSWRGRRPGKPRKTVAGAQRSPLHAGAAGWGVK